MNPSLSRQRWLVLCSIAACLLLLACAPVRASSPPGAAVHAPGINASAAAPDANLLAFTAGGHALGFRSDAVFVASRDHALRVEFVGARAVTPTTDGEAHNLTDTPSTVQPRMVSLSNHPTSNVPSVSRVTYANLWDGITLTYDTPNGGIVRSTYTLAPFASVAQIHLRYNAPVSVNAGIYFAAAQSPTAFAAIAMMIFQSQCIVLF